MRRDHGNKLIDVSIELIEKLYVHLPLKRSMYAINPVQRLRLLQRRLNSTLEALTQRQFYNEMLQIFSLMRDLHTAFVLPEPFRSATAYLPFRLEVCIENAKRRYIVSEVMPSTPENPITPINGFKRGAEVTHWNGVPIDRAVAANAERESGSNAAAHHAQGLASMTIRWLGQSLPPDEDWVDIRFIPDRNKTTSRNARFSWRVFTRQTPLDHEVARASGARLQHLGLDTRGELERLARRFLFGKQRRPPLPKTKFGHVDEIESFMPDVFPSSGSVKTPYGRFAYMRIATFNVEDDALFLDEFIRIAGELSQEGMILDVRGNLGGLIHAGERLLQLLTPRAIDPCRFHFLNSTRTERITQRRAFKAWNDSIAQAVETGAEYSQGLPLLALEKYNDIGQKYQGPVVLITDALSYSTTDIFAAGFQDNRIGKVLGVDKSTGAGGANVWEYSLISDLLRRRGPFPKTLPSGASFRFAVRRVTRVGRAAGVPLEDFGVRTDAIHQFTRRDVLERNVDLIRNAAEMLSTMDRQKLVATIDGQDAIGVRCKNIDRVDAYLGDRPMASFKVRDDRVQIPMPPHHAGLVLRLNGFRKRTLVAATRIALN